MGIIGQETRIAIGYETDMPNAMKFDEPCQRLAIAPVELLENVGRFAGCLVVGHSPTAFP
jgi:hypothetical protein